MPSTSISFVETPLLAFTLGQADDALVLGHRLSQWCGHAPLLEEDIALANIALDHIGQARALYGYAASLAGFGEDDFAFLRDAGQFRNCLLVELPNGDFAATIVRQFLYTAFVDLWWRAMTLSADATLAAIAAKAEKESAYHLRHSAEWLIRLGDGTAESHARAQRALDAQWMYTGELFEPDPATSALIARRVAVEPKALRANWNSTIGAVWLLRGPSQWWRSSSRAKLLAQLRPASRSARRLPDRSRIVHQCTSTALPALAAPECDFPPFRRRDE